MAQKLTTYQQARLQVVAYRVIQAIVGEVLAPYSLNTSQWVTIGYLSDVPEGLRVSAIADLLRVETPLVTALTQSLQKNGMITSETDERDKRAKLLRLTDKGREVVKEIEPILTERLDALDAGLTPEDVRTYFTVLQRVVEASANTRA
jgi:DNA-binding MarR family transcriptional regulator